jgi:transcription elongation factor GreA
MAFIYLTQEGNDRLKAELEELKTVGRSEASKAIAEAREKGDLSENAEYDAAKEAQGLLELRINDIEKTLSKSRVLDSADLDTSKVGVFMTVRIMHQKLKKEFTYKLVSEAEADLKSGKISVTSPIGRALLGKRIGEVAEAETPSGSVLFQILDISLS